MTTAKLLIITALLLCLWGPSYGQQCANEDFEEGTTNHWQGYTGYITADGIVDVQTPGIVNGRHTIMSGVEVDPIAESCGINLLTVEASGSYSLRLGNDRKGREAERITHTFVVEPNKTFFLYKYAVVLEDPDHDANEQPRFEVRVFDKNGNLASCGEYKVRAGNNAQNDGFQLCDDGWFKKYWIKNWTVAGADLSAFVGQQVTVEFLTTDCAQGAHAGYAYVEASCKSLDIQLEKFCPDTPGTLSFNASVTEGFQSYKWDNGDTGTTTTYTNKKYGDVISVTVSTYTGCSSTISRVLEAPDPVSINPIPDLTVCKNTKFSLEASGTNVGFFLWGDGTKANKFITSVTKDSVITYEAYDINGCPTGIKDEINVSIETFDFDFDKSDITCKGLDDGTIKLTPPTYGGPYSYLWSDGNTSASRNNMPPGNHKVTITNATGCKKDYEFTLTEPSGIVINTKTTISHCTKNDGTAEVTVTGGIPPYTYQWEGLTGETTNKLTNVGAGDYSVIITDNNGNGCNTRARLKVDEPQLSAEFSSIDPRCTLDDGSIEAHIKGGTGNYSYNWSNGEKTKIIDNLMAGDYILHVEDEYGCALDDTVTLAPPPPPPLSLSITTTQGQCTADEASATADVLGGHSPYSYNWSNGGTTNTISNLSPNTYYLTVIDLYNCEIKDSVTINSPADLLHIDVISKDAMCNNNDGYAEANIKGGTAPYSTLWLPGNQTDTVVSDLTVGNHIVIVVDANQCLDTAAVTIGPPNLMTLELDGVDPLCVEDDGSITALIQGGAGNKTFSWNNGGTTSKIENLKGGIYTVQVKDENGCTVEASDTLLAAPSPLSIFTSLNDPICAPNEGSASVTAQGGTPPYKYLWSTGEADTVINNLAPGPYDIQVIDDNNCEVAEAITINPPPPLLEIAATSKDATCNEYDGKAQVTISGGTPPYSTIWSPTNQTATEIDSLTVGNYTVIVSDTNGCTDTAEVSVAAPSNLMELELEAEGESYSLKNGVAKVTVKGGIEPYAYLWTPGNGTDRIYRNIPTGLYTVNVTDGNGCQVSDSILVPELPPIDIPNAFTPNGDSYNEFWILKNIDKYPNAVVKVYNRWGNLVFESNGYTEPWAGITGATQYPTDTYYYVIDLSLNIKPFTGYVDIIK